MSKVLVAADESYLTTITGKQPAHPLLDGKVPLEALADRTRELGPRWDALAGLDIGEDLDIWHHGIAVGLMQETGMAQD